MENVDELLIFKNHSLANSQYIVWALFFNMQEETCTPPEVQYIPYNWLKTLQVYEAEGVELQLTPTFNLKTDQEYYLVVDAGNDLLQVEAKAVSSGATVFNTGFHGLDYGSNTIMITVLAENNEVRNYTIIVVRQD